MHRQASRRKVTLDRHRPKSWIVRIRILLVFQCLLLLQACFLLGAGDQSGDGFSFSAPGSQMPCYSPSIGDSSLGWAGGMSHRPGPPVHLAPSCPFSHSSSDREWAWGSRDQRRTLCSTFLSAHRCEFSNIAALFWCQRCTSHLVDFL